MDIDTQNSKARSTAYLCYFLAALVMLVTAWLIVEGIQATEPASSARHAKVAAGVLLILIEGFAFHAASRWHELSGMLRLLGWCVFGLQITLMSLAQIATGTTAGKVAALSTATVAEVRAQADESRKNAQVFRDSADKLNKSRHGWLNQQGGEKATAAAKETAVAAGALDRLDKLQAVAASTPIVQLIGTWGLIVLSISISVIFELAGIVLMHTAGKLSRRADSQPVDQQILGMLQQMTGGTPASPALPAAVVKQVQAQADTHSPAAPRPAFDFGFIPSKPAQATSVQARHDAPDSGELWTAPRREYFLAPAHPAKPDTAPASVPPAAPARPAEPPISAPALVKQAQPAVLKQAHPAPASVPAQAHQPGPVTVLEQAQSAATTVPAQAQSPAARPARKSCAHRSATAVADGSKLDAGTSGKAASRYNRIKAAVSAGSLKPSVRSLQLVEGGGTLVNRRYLQQLVKDGLIERKGRGYTRTAVNASQLSLQGV